MTTELALAPLLARIKLPPQDQNKLSFCDSTKAARVAEWASELPATRITHTSVLLYQALPEITRLETSIHNRLEMLESLRPYVQRCITGLSQNFLNKPLILPEGAMKTAVIAQALQKHMTNSYCLVVMQLLERVLKQKSKPQEQDDLLLAIHRAQSGLSLQLLRSTQLYAPIPSQLWDEVHALYLITEQLNFLHKTVQDPVIDNRASSCEQVYMRTLLLASAKPNQLNQTDVQTLFDTLDDWSKFVHLNPKSKESRNLFIIDLNSNNGPVYKQRCEDASGDDVRELDVSPLLDTIHKQQEDSSLKLIDIPRAMSKALLHHITEAWGVSRQRSQQRRATNGSLDVVIGLSNIHFHISGGVQFKSFVLSRGRTNLDDKSNPFEESDRERFSAKALTSEADPWANSFDAEGGHILTEVHISTTNIENTLRDHEAELHKDNHPIHQVPLQDASPGGYCLNWQTDIPPQVKAGEILGLREPGRQQWLIGVIRWVRQSKGASLLGIQLLSPEAEPYAIQQIQKTGEDGAFMRAIVVPPVTRLKIPATVITAAIPFQEKNKVRFNHQGHIETAQLQENLFATSSIQQFSFRVLERMENKSPTTNEAFGGDWS